jgi:hypothetical protein
MPKTMWLVGKFIAVATEGVVWEFQGIFETRDLAEAACRNERYCVQTVELNKEIPDETVPFPDSLYPKEQKPTT